MNNKYKESVDLIIENINDIYKRYNALNLGKFELTWIDREKDKDLFKKRILGFKLEYSYPGKNKLSILSRLMEIPHYLESKDEIALELFYSSCMNDLLRYLLFAKDNNNFDINNNPLVIKSIQTLITEDKNY